MTDQCPYCHGTGKERICVGFHYKNNQDPIFALKCDYEIRPCRCGGVAMSEGGHDEQPAPPLPFPGDATDA